MKYIVSVLVDKSVYLYALASKTRKAAMNKVFAQSLFTYYDSDKKLLSAPLSLTQLYKLCNQNTDCMFKIIKQQNAEENGYFRLDTGSDLAYIPAYCITSNARITKYRYVVISKVCDAADTVKYVRLFDTVTRREMQLPVENVYAMHNSDAGMHVEVIANMRIAKSANGYKISAIQGNIPIERFANDNAEPVANNTVKTVNNPKFKIEYVNEGKTVLTGINLNYSWDNDNATELILPSVAYVAMKNVIKNDAYCDALKNVKTLKIPKTVQQMDCSFLRIMPKLCKIVSENANFVYSEEGTLFSKAENRICWVAPDCKQKHYKIADNVIVSHYAFSASNVIEVVLGNGVKLERTAFADSKIGKLVIGAGVKLMPGCFRGMQKLTKIEIKEELTEDFVVQLLDMNQWLGLEDYNIKTQHFTGKTPRSISFIGDTAPKTVAMINTMLAVKQQLA